MSLFISNNWLKLATYYCIYLLQLVAKACLYYFIVSAAKIEIAAKV